MSNQRGGENDEDDTNILTDRSQHHVVDSAVVVVHQSAGEPLKFSREKYATRGVALGLDDMLQNVLWRLIEQIPIAERDYLQVFILTAKFDSKRGILQNIVHKQEAPFRHWEHEYPTFRPVCGKLFAIDDGNGNGTLLWADEY